LIEQYEANKYDVFISFKNTDEINNRTKDSYIAEDLYKFLKEKGIKVFLSSRELEKIGTAQYKSVIDDVLDSARILIVVGCSRKHLEAPWVRHEWDSFHNAILSSRKPNGQIFVVYKDMEINELPLALASQQAFNANDKSSFNYLFGFIENAIKVKQEYIQKGTAEYHISEGNKYIECKDYNQALRELTTAIKIDQKNCSAYNSRGVSLFLNNEYEKSLYDFTQAIKLTPNLSVYYRNRAAAYQALGKFSKAITDYTHAIKRDPQSIILYGYRGDVFYNKKKYKKAIADYSYLLNIDPFAIQAYKKRGIAFHFTKKYDQAIQDFSKVISLNPEECKYHLWKAEAHYKNKDYNKAINEYNLIINKQSDNYTSVYNIALIYLFIGEWDIAQNYFNQLLSSHPDIEVVKNIIHLLNLWKSSFNKPSFFFLFLFKRRYKRFFISQKSTDF
jgi:tetratricopeptide (TPR) repeat protein